MVKRLKLLGSLCVLMLFTSGCMNFGAWGIGPLRVYNMGGSPYFTRSGADEAHKKHLKEILSKTNKVPEPVAEKCVLVIPTYWWFKNSCIWTTGAATSPVGCLGVAAHREASIDYIMSGMQRGINTLYAMIKKSGLFKDCEIVSAKDGNGEDEYTPTGNTFVVRMFSKSKGNCLFQLFSPDGKSYEFTDHDLVSDAHSGWKKFSGKIKKLTAN